eukprot:5253745-Amphidinium_carterae.1
MNCCVSKTTYESTVGASKFFSRCDDSYLTYGYREVGGVLSNRFAWTRRGTNLSMKILAMNILLLNPCRLINGVDPLDCMKLVVALLPAKAVASLDCV